MHNTIISLQHLIHDRKQAPFDFGSAIFCRLYYMCPVNVSPVPVSMVFPVSLPTDI